MKHAIVLSLVAALPLAAAEIPAGGQLTIPFSEYRTLLEKSLLPPPAKQVSLQAVLSTRFRVEASSAGATGSVEFEILNTGSEAKLVPLIGEEVTILAVEPRETVLVREDGFYQMLVPPSQPRTVNLGIAWTARSEEDRTSYQCRVVPSAMLSLSLGKLSPGEHAEIPGALRDAKTGEYHLGAADVLNFQIRKAAKEAVVGEVVMMPPVISEASATMRLVSDGTFITATKWSIRHHEAFVWKLNPGEGTQLVSASIGGRPVAPVQTPGGELEFRIPRGESPALVEMTYTGKTSAFGTVRGNLSVALPSTDLLVERTQWSLLLPSGYVPAAVEGNADFLPAELTNEIRLQKELTRGEAPTARIYYQKPESTKNP